MCKFSLYNIIHDIHLRHDKQKKYKQVKLYNDNILNDIKEFILDYY